jgi:hypothetical protein
VSEEPTADQGSTPTDPSLEFDTFERVRTRLAEVLVARGYPPLDAAQIALYVVQGIRGVPDMLRLFALNRSPTPDEILAAVGHILDEAPALERAKSLLLNLEVGQPEAS